MSLNRQIHQTSVIGKEKKMKRNNGNSAASMFSKIVSAICSVLVNVVGVVGSAAAWVAMRLENAIKSVGMPLSIPIYPFYWVFAFVATVCTFIFFILLRPRS